MQTNTRDNLLIFFKGTEVPGILVYGFWARERADCPAFADQYWPVKIQYYTSHLHSIEKGSPWTIWVWNIHIESWPTECLWNSIIKNTLQVFTMHGAKVAWCGLEGAFLDPPLLFRPEMQNGVWAGLKSDGNFLCHSSLEKPFEPLKAEELLKLHQAAFTT